MTKTQLTKLADAIVNFIADTPAQRNNLVEWADSYLENTAIGADNEQFCQWCEKYPAEFTHDWDADSMPDQICKKCLMTNMYEFLDSLKNVKHP